MRDEKLDGNNKYIQRFVELGEAYREDLFRKLEELESRVIDEFDMMSLSESYSEILLILKQYRELTAPGANLADRWRKLFRERIAELDSFAEELEEIDVHDPHTQEIIIERALKAYRNGADFFSCHV